MVGVYQEDDDGNDLRVTHVLTKYEMLNEGLLLANYSEQKIGKCGETTNHCRFINKFGVSPTVMCNIYNDLQCSTAEDMSVNPPQSMRMNGSDENLKWLLRSMIYVKKYPLESDFETEFHLTARYARRQIWNVLEKIQCLKEKKVTWPDDLDFESTWIMTVDGTHVWINRRWNVSGSQ